MASTALPRDCANGVLEVLPEVMLAARVGMRSLLESQFAAAPFPRPNLLGHALSERPVQHRMKAFL